MVTNVCAGACDDRKHRASTAAHDISNFEAFRQGVEVFKQWAGVRHWLSIDFRLFITCYFDWLEFDLVGAGNLSKKSLLNSDGRASGLPSIRNPGWQLGSGHPTGFATFGNYNCSRSEERRVR